MTEDDQCGVHDIKCKEWTKTSNRVDALEKSKLSIRMFQLIAFIAISLGGGYWYNADQKANANLMVAMKHQGKASAQLEEHIRVSNIILKGMSHALREQGLNQRIVMKKLQLEFQEIPDYYGDDSTD